MARRHSDSESDEESIFLAHEKEESSLKAEIEEALVPPRRSRRVLLLCGRTFICLLHILFLAINVFWATANFRYQSASRTAESTAYEPWGAPYKKEFIQFDMQLGEKSPYTTFDRAVADEAWEAISMKQGSNIGALATVSVGWLQVSQEKVDLMEQPSVKFHDGSGYFFGMDVFHQLHCLNYLRKKTVLYNHLYPSEHEIEDEQVPPEFHIPHCIDSLRLSLQCHADLTLVPQRWSDGWLEPWAVWTNKHTCRNFNAIRDWAAANTPKTTGRLRHPKLGTVVSGRLNLSALPVWEETHDRDVVLGHMPVCLKPQSKET